MQLLLYDGLDPAETWLTPGQGESNGHGRVGGIWRSRSASTGVRIGQPIGRSRARSRSDRSGSTAKSAKARPCVPRAIRPHFLMPSRTSVPRLFNPLPRMRVRGGCPLPIPTAPSGFSAHVPRIDRTPGVATSNSRGMSATRTRATASPPSPQTRDSSIPSTCDRPELSERRTPSEDLGRWTWGCARMRAVRCR